MKITGYQSSVGTGGVANAAIKTVGNALAYGMDGSGYAAMGKMYGSIAAAIEKQNEDEDKQNILNAMDVFNKSRYNIMYNDESGLMNTKLEGSAGIGQSYNEQIGKVRQEVLGNTKLHSRKNRLALDHLMYNSAQEGFQTVDRYQQKQKEAVIDLRYANNIQNSSEYVQKNWYTPGAIDAAIKNSVLMTSLTYGGRGAAFVEAKSRESVGQVVASAINASIINEDYATIRTYLDKYGSLLTAEQRTSFEKISYAKESSAFERNAAKDLFAKYGGDEAAVRDALSKMSGFSGGENGDEFSKLMESFGIQESGGNYNAKNGRTGASGKYQILPENWPKWSKEAGLAEGAEMTPKNQEKVARFKLRQYYDKYGAEGAAVAWYSGETNAERWVNGQATDVWGQPWDAPQHGNEPSIKEYAKIVAGRAGGAQTARPMSVDEQDRIMTQYKRLVAEQKATKKYEDNQRLENNMDNLYQLKQNGGTYDQAMAWAEQDAAAYAQGSGRKYGERRAANEKAVKLVFGTKAANSKGIGVGGRDIMADYLRSGRFANEEEFLTFAQANGANEQDLHALQNTYKQYETGAGIFKFDLEAIASDMIPNGLMGEARNKAKWSAKSYANNAIREYRAQHNGEDPTYQEVVEMVQKGFTDTVSGSYVTKKGRLWDTTKDFSYSRADLAGRGISNISQSATDPNIYYVDYSNGKSGVMFADELDHYMGGKQE